MTASRIACSASRNAVRGPNPVTEVVHPGDIADFFVEVALVRAAMPLVPLLWWDVTAA